MKKTSYPINWPDIDTALYNRSVKLFRAVKNLLSVKFELHADKQVLQGDIFLFNHFSRFETFIPQFLIFEKTGAYSCAIASGEFFQEENILSNYLQQVGVFPHDHPRLFAMLAGQILRGRKIIIFPEGGMVKDRRVLDKQGEYSIYSRITGIRRKHHTGPAVLGQGVEALKVAIRYAFKHGQMDRLHHWKEVLQFNNLDELMAVSLKPTLIVPANITFYPIRSSENLLFKSVELFSDKLSLRQSEELLIEGNILLKDTDMDIRMGKPVNPCCVWDWQTHFVMNRVAPYIRELEDVFKLKSAPRNWKESLLGFIFLQNAKCSRNKYMNQIYSNVTVNLSHLASTLIMNYVNDKRYQIEKKQFYHELYIAIKKLQKNPEIHLHRSLLNPEDYCDVIYGTSSRFDQFISVAKEADLIAEQDCCYHFLPALWENYDFDEIRLENPIAVYNNEVAPLSEVRTTLEEADKEFHKINPIQLAAWHFEDEQLILSLEQQRFSTSHRAGELNLPETAIADPAPFFFIPKKANGVGILLIHGLLASPAEVYDYGHYLANQGYTVMGIRLKGHGTSPYALQDVKFEQWFKCVQRGFRIVKLHCRDVFIMGFSTGGALALKLAAENHQEVLGVVAVSVPIKFVNPAFMLVPLLQGTNALVQRFSSLEGVKPFIENTPEHPDINYCNTPVRALFELRRLIEDLEKVLPKISTPSLLLYADNDPIVAPQSSKVVFDNLSAEHKYLHAIKSNRHGILMENIGNTWAIIDDFLNQQRPKSNKY